MQLEYLVLELMEDEKPQVVWDIVYCYFFLFFESFVLYFYELLYFSVWFEKEKVPSYKHY